MRRSSRPRPCIILSVKCWSVCQTSTNKKCSRFHGSAAGPKASFGSLLAAWLSSIQALSSHLESLVMRYAYDQALMRCLISREMSRIPEPPSTMRLTGGRERYCVAFAMILSWKDLRYGSVSISLGRAAHLYEGAMIRGRSGRSSVTSGVAGVKVSVGHAAEALAAGVNVGAT